MSSRAWLLFAAVSVVWGVPYFFIKVAVDADVPPAFVAWSRIALGAAILLPLAVHRGALRGLGDRRRPIALYAATEIAVPFTLIAIGEQHVSSSLTAILIASMPLMVAVLSPALLARGPPERDCGWWACSSGWAAWWRCWESTSPASPSELLGAALILVATVGYATAPIVVKRSLADLDPLGPVAVSLGVSDARAATRGHHRAAGRRAVARRARIDRRARRHLHRGRADPVLPADRRGGPSRASVITYFNPLVALALGLVVLDEHLGAASAVGLALILAGSWLATGGRPSQLRRGAAVATASEVR